MLVNVACPGPAATDLTNSKTMLSPSPAMSKHYGRLHKNTIQDSPDKTDSHNTWQQVAMQAAMQAAAALIV
jgi:hypothetical protein